MPTIFFTITLILTSTLLTFSLLFIGWFILKPYLLFRFYKEQRAQGYFKPFGGFFHDRMREARQEGDFLHYFKETIRQNPNVKVIASNIGSQAMLYLIDPDMIKEFVNQPQLYKKAEFISGIEGLFEGQGILFIEGERWKRQRKLLTSSFHHELLKTQVPLISKAADEVYSSITKNSNTKGLTNIPNVNIMKVNQQVAGNVIGQLFFGKSYSHFTFEGLPITLGLRKLLRDGFKEMYTVWNGVFGAWFIKTGILPHHKALMKRIRDMRMHLRDIIREVKKNNRVKRQNEQETTLLDSLLQQQMHTMERGMTEDEVVDNFISLFLAGTEPTGNLASMVLYYLTQNPEVYRKLMEEIDRVVVNEREISFEQIHKLEYTLAVINETLRKANPQGILVFRQAVDHHKLGGLFVRRGTLVSFSPILNGYNPKYFANYNEFKPERWLTGVEKGRELKSNPFAFIPFSAGPRTCLGHHLALIEVKVMLCSLLKKFKVEMEGDCVVKMTNRATYEPLETMRMRLTSR